MIKILLKRPRDLHTIFQLHVIKQNTYLAAEDAKIAQMHSKWNSKFGYAGEVVNGSSIV